MKKVIGITCDNHKAEKFRNRLLEKGFALSYDGKGPIHGVHLFKIEVLEKEFKNKTDEISKILTQLDIEIKQSN